MLAKRCDLPHFCALPSIFRTRFVPSHTEKTPQQRISGQTLARLPQQIAKSAYFRIFSGCFLT